MTKNYYQEDPNPYNWTADQHNIPTWRKILGGLKHHLTKNKSLIIRLRAVWTYVLAEFFQKRIVFSYEGKWTAFDWRTLKLSQHKATEEYEEDEKGKVIREETGTLFQEWEKYPWQKKLKEITNTFTPFTDDQFQMFIFENAYEEWRDHMCECSAELDYEQSKGGY